MSCEISQHHHGVASLQPITSETFNKTTANRQNGARLDVVANGFWGSPFERAFFDVRVFNPFAPSNRHTSLSASYRHHENLKKRHYEQRIREVEHSSFTPLVFATTGGLGPAATAFYKRLASMLSDKWKQPYSTTIGWLRCRISFSLLLTTQILHYVCQIHKVIRPHHCRIQPLRLKNSEHIII